jgi:sec-independent protein translocase protein TatB
MLSIPHMIVVFVIVLVVFGPQKLPELARGLGKLMAEFRKASTDFKSAFEEEMRDIERQAREVERRKAEAAASAATAVQPQPATLATPSRAETQPDGTELTAGAAATEATAGADTATGSSVDGPVLAPVPESTFARDVNAEVEAAAGETGASSQPEDAGLQEPNRASTDH